MHEIKNLGLSSIAALILSVGCVKDTKSLLSEQPASPPLGVRVIGEVLALKQSDKPKGNRYVDSTIEIATEECGCLPQMSLQIKNCSSEEPVSCELILEGKDDRCERACLPVVIRFPLDKLGLVGSKYSGAVLKIKRNPPESFSYRIPNEFEIRLGKR